MVKLSHHNLIILMLLCTLLCTTLFYIRMTKSLGWSASVLRVSYDLDAKAKLFQINN